MAGGDVATPRGPELLALLTDLAAAANGGLSDAALFGRLCEALSRTGVPLWRAAMQLENLHPLYYGYCLHWYEGADARDVQRSHEFAASREFAESPYMASLRAGGSYRCRIEVEPEPELPLLRDLKARGATDFLAEIVAAPDPMPPGVTWATRRDGGFAAGDIALLRALTPHLGPLFGLGAQRRKTASLLGTYLGSGPSREVLEGRVTRAEVLNIEAVVLLTDLRGFSAKAAAWSDAELLAALDGYFEAVADAVAAHGGDVLKFLGDGCLAVFSVDAPGGLPSRCRAAAAAVADARAAVARLNAGRAAAGREPLEFTAVLHAGPLAFGNVGARERLDFTVIGPAVNAVSRIEAVAKALGEAALATEEVARHLDGSVRGLGRHALRGLPGTLELFAI